MAGDSPSGGNYESVRWNERRLSVIKDCSYSQANKTAEGKGQIKGVVSPPRTPKTLKMITRSRTVSRKQPYIWLPAYTTDCSQIKASYSFERSLLPKKP